MKNTKIRSWNKFENQFFYFQNGRYFKDSDCKKCVSERICSEFIWSNAEWYTSLHDKNGKEIYEGDVIKVPYNFIGNIKVAFEKGIYNISKYNISVVEIIGNIHTTPELLNPD